MALRIEDYALIGDTHTAALVGNDGSIDWMCVPRFDSGAVFASLLGTPDHGRWQVAPAGGLQRVERSYHGDTLVLETTFHTDDGVVRLTDFMPIRRHVVQIVRIVEGIAGRVPDFASRAKAAVLFSVAAAAFMRLGEPIFYHHDWAHFIYLFIADALALSVAGLIIARWFLPGAGMGATK